MLTASDKTGEFSDRVVASGEERFPLFLKILKCCWFEENMDKAVSIYTQSKVHETASKS